MATVRIIQRSKKSLTLVIDYGIDPVTQKRKKETRTLHTTDMEVAEVERLKVLAELAQGLYKPTSKVTVKEYFEYWFTTTAAKKLASKTIERYKQCADLRIIPWIGHIKLCDLQRTDLQKFYDRIVEVGRLDNLKPNESEDNKKPKIKKPIGKDTIAHHHRLIRRVLNHAVYEDEILTRNVAARINLPEPEQPDGYDPDEGLVKVFTADEISKLEKAAQPTPYSNLLSTALRTGMRREELLALTWDCIDFKKHTIFIKQALVYTKEKGYELKPTKNKKKRLIEVTEEVLNAFRSEACRQAPHKIRLKKKYDQEKKLIFCRENGYYMHPDTISSWFPEFCIECGVTRLNFHCLRHTHASHLLSAGEDISYVSKRLGHSSIHITYNTYFHFIPLEKREALKELEKRFKK
jgi:integrase